MGIKCSKTSNVGNVEKYIDTAYDNVKKVADSLESLLNLNATFTNLRGIYLGEFSTAPALRPDTTPLLDGDHYLNTVTSLLYVRIGGGWIYHSIFYTQTALTNAVGAGPFNIWIVYADDNMGTGISLSPTGKNFVGFANGRVGTSPDINSPGIYTFSRYVGADGKDAYAHFAYADSSDGVTNFNYSAGTHIGQYTSDSPTRSGVNTDYTWNRIRGFDGTNGTNGTAGVGATVTDNGNGTYTITGANGSVYLSDGEIPTVTDNGDGTYTITSGIESIIVKDGKTLVRGVDFYDGNNGDYVSFVYAQVVKGTAAPIITSGTGSWNGTVETYPTGATWTDNPVFTPNYTTYISSNRYMHIIATDSWVLRNNDWSVPAIFMQDVEKPAQSQIKGFSFKRSVSPLNETPTGGSFLNPNPTTTGWSDGIPTGVAPIYVSVATFTSDGLTPQSTGNPVVWSQSVLLAENGTGFKHRFGPTITGPWSDIPSVTDEYMITSVRDNAGIWVDDTSNPIRIKGETGIAPQSKLRAFAFKRSTSPTFSETPTGGTYGSPNPVDGAVSGWSDGIPVGSARLYVSTRTFTSDGLTPQNTSWSASQVFSYNGTGFRILFSIDGATNWHQEPTVDDEWAQPQTSVDGGLTWVNSGIAYKFKGEQGPPGISVANLVIYRRNATLPTTPTGGEYDFDTLTLTPPTNWTVSPLETADPLYICSAYASNTLGQVDNTLTWSAPGVLSTAGNPGAAGPRGSRHFYTTVANGVWSDTVADAYIVAQGETKIGWDVVTISDSANGFAESRYWDLAADPDQWTVIAEVIDGNLVVLGTIGADKIAANSITAGQIAANTITASQIAADTITATQIAANAITASELSAGAVIAGKIAAGAIAVGDLGNGIITAAKIANGTITGTLISGGTITTTNIAANTITAGDIAVGTITANEIAANTITAGQIAVGTITADELAVNSIQASKIAVGAIKAEHLSIGTSGAEGGNNSGVKITFDPYASAPITIINATTDVTVFAVQLVDGSPKAVIDAVGGTGFIDNPDAITDAVKRSINPYYVGGGSTDSAAAGSMASLDTQALTITAGPDGIVNVNFALGTSGDYFGPTNQNYTAPSWRVEVKRGATSLYNKVHTGSAFNIQDTETGAGGDYTCQYSLTINQGFVDTNSGTSGSVVYTMTVTKISGTATTLLRSVYKAEVPSITKNTIDTNTTGGYSWTDKETGFTIKSGYVAAIAGNGTTVVTFTNAFSTVWSGVASSDNTDVDDWGTGSVTALTTAQITIQNQDNDAHNFRWVATGYINV